MNKYQLKVFCIAGLIFFGSCGKEEENIIDNNNSITDSRDGSVYKTVTIGNQVWMAENLKYLPSVVGSSTGSNTVSHYYVYGFEGISVNDAKATSNYSTYGVLYNWPAAMNGEASSNTNPSGVQGICPDGWHLPSREEFMELIEFLGESNAGSKLKAAGSTYWNKDKGTNESGFTALGSGFRSHFTEDFIGFKTDTYFWTSNAQTLQLNQGSVNLNPFLAISVNVEKGDGSCIRCVKN